MAGSLTFSSSTARSTWIALAAIVASALLVYSNALHVPFLLDDLGSVVENESIRDLGAPGAVLSPPAKAGVGGRPVSNLSLAINYALGGLSVRGYHVVNLAIHLLAGLTLFGLVRRTLARPTLGETFAGGLADRVALAAAALWLLHPLQTITVNYVSQRTESLMALFYMLTLYCFARGVDAPRPRRWFAAMMIACFLGVGSKEIIATAPLMVFLYDRTFVAGAFRAAWRARWPWHLALASSWAWLAWLLRDVHERGAGLDAGEVPAWVYALTSCRTLIEYLRLTIWPHPLIFDRGAGIAPPGWPLAPYIAAAAALAAAVVFVWWRRAAAGFAAVWFFIVLAPTTSVVPVAFQPMAENRVYLALAGPLALLAAWLHRALGVRRAAIVCAALALAAGAASYARNRDYRTVFSIWEDTLAKRPENSRALNSYGWALQEAGRMDEALRQFERAMQTGRDGFEAFVAHHSYGRALLQLGRLDEAAAYFRRALEFQPDSFEARNNLGTTLLQAGDPAAALSQLEAAAALEPQHLDVQLNRALALLRLGRRAEALAATEQAARTHPKSADAQRHLASLLAAGGRADEAGAHFARAIELAPEDARVRSQFGEFLAQRGHLTEALAQFEAAVRLRPDFALARHNLAAALAVQGRFDEARVHLEEAVRLQPNNREWQENLARLRAQKSSTP